MSTPSLRILVVDDNDALRENLAEALELEGYEVAVAANGEEALAKLAQDPLPDVVLLDLRMPGLDGGEILTRIREDVRLAGIRVVMTTGASGVRERLANADAILKKPFGVRELLAAVERVSA